MAEFDDQGGSTQNAAGTTEGGAASGQPLPTFMWKPREDSFAGEMKPDDKTMGLLCHLLGIFGFLGPLIIWLVKKDESRYVDIQGKEALNFQLSYLIYFVVAYLSVFAVVGCVLFPIVWVLWLVVLIIATIRANNGIIYRYPLAIRFIK